LYFESLIQNNMIIIQTTNLTLSLQLMSTTRVKGTGQVLE